MSTRYELVSEVTVNGHTYECYDVRPDDELVDEVARLVCELYVDPEVWVDSLRKASAELGSVAADEELSQLLDEVAASVVPQMDMQARKLHLQTPRNEVAEILAYDALRTLHKVIIPASRVREKEVSGQPTRGVDIFALVINPNVRAVISEVKASSDGASPPGVVSVGDDSMHAQTKKRLKDRNTLLRELNWAHKHTSPELKVEVAKALILLSKKDAEPPIAAPVLVRPVESYRDTDFGCFKEAPDEYAPAQVRFLVLRLPGTLEDFANRVYARAREVA
ncbi:hypothetical protein [Streptomyces rhizosphaericus]|uniref:Anti-bacteriophage protein A/HamA C-terminal domain-containing protein n=1 Tax=Streptomyces rhizosphaericus TaxID=114699 RepID=A0ABN1RP81_9ACTN|nr:hypothetical protein [Streptomyces cangkringensis]